jgi:hypothetical protein
MLRAPDSYGADAEMRALEAALAEITFDPA